MAIHSQQRDGQGGFIASYLLYGIGLLAVVGFAYGRLSTMDQQSQQVQQTVDELGNQLDVLTGKILLCAAVYPDGNHGQFDTRHAYPAPATADNRDVVSAIECPGAPAGGRGLAAMPDGVPLPVSPPDFSEWNYEHTLTNGIRLRLSPVTAGGASAVRLRLSRQYPSTASVDGDTLVFTILN